MDCRERILSNDYRDVITDYPIRPGTEDLCYVNINDTFNIAFINRAGLPPVMEAPYEYQNTPKLYGPMQLTGEPEAGAVSPGPAPFDVNSLVESGIIQVQRQPLNLTGEGVVLCVIDSGE